MCRCAGRQRQGARKARAGIHKGAGKQAAARKGKAGTGSWGSKAEPRQGIQKAGRLRQAAEGKARKPNLCVGRTRQEPGKRA